MKPRRVVVNDLMQTDYVYTLIEPPGKRFHPDFEPELTPKQMLRLGCPARAGAKPEGPQLPRLFDY